MDVAALRQTIANRVGHRLHGFCFCLLLLQAAIPMQLLAFCRLLQTMMTELMARLGANNNTTFPSACDDEYERHYIPPIELGNFCSMIENRRTMHCMCQHAFSFTASYCARVFPPLWTQFGVCKSLNGLSLGACLHNMKLRLCSSSRQVSFQSAGIELNAARLHVGRLT